MTLRDDLIAAKAQFRKFGGKSIQAAHLGACRGSPTARASLVALRKALPPGFPDFHHFESSRSWRAKEAHAVFDRAIAAATENTGEAAK